MIYSIMREQPNFLTNLPRAVRFAIIKIPWQLDVRSESGHRPGSSRDRDISAGHKHPRPYNVAVIDGVAKRDIVQGTIHANITHGGEAGLQCRAGIGNRLEHHLRCSPLQL